MKFPNTILVEIEHYRYGGFLITPSSERWQGAFQEAVIRNGGPDEPSAFLQVDEEDIVSLFDLRPEEQRHLREWGSIRIKADPWVVGECYGYDAARIVEESRRKR